MRAFSREVRWINYAAAIMLSGCSAVLVSTAAVGQKARESAPNDLSRVESVEPSTPTEQEPKSVDDLVKRWKPAQASASRKKEPTGKKANEEEILDLGGFVPVAPPEDLLKAAKQGDSNAQVNLGFMYERGQVVAQNLSEAIRWYRKAADQGEPTAQNNLGVMYQQGMGVTPDNTEAMRWYRKAAEQGFRSSQMRLGAMYDAGDGVPKDYAEAFRWYQKAAEHGDADAQLMLGVRYEQGQGVPQDYSAAAHWYWLAAEQGDVSAQGHLSRMYAYGYGVSKDYVQAHLWMNLAASGTTGYDQLEYAHERDLLTAKMSGRQVMEAQRLAREWKPKTGLAAGVGPPTGARLEPRTILWWCILIGVAGIAGIALARMRQSG